MILLFTRQLTHKCNHMHCCAEGLALQCLSFFFVAYHQIYLDNEAPDSLSRNIITPFLQLVPTAQPLPTPLPGLQDTRLDVRRMDDRAAFYFAEGLASSTIRTYGSGQERFLKYCQSNNSVAFPATEVVLYSFAAHLADVGLKHRSIKIYMSGVRFFQIKAGCSDPFQ